MENSQTSKRCLSIDGNSLTIDQLTQVARCYLQVSLADSARRQVHECEIRLRELASLEKPIYGVNTGLGIFANRRIKSSQSIQLSRNLILSHAVGIGEPFPEDVVRAAILIRVNTFAKGHSGVRPELIELLLEMLNRRLTPHIPNQGSLGSSGDLAPLSHLALVLSQDPISNDEASSGKAWFKGQLMSGKEAMNAAGLSPLILHSKEGLAIINGAAFAAALLALACNDTLNLLRIAEIGASLSMEALLAVSNAFDPRLHEVRSHLGQIAVAERIRKLLRSSTLIDSTERVQDAYSIRCTPQVIGPAWDILSFVQSTALREINAATDNPLFFGLDAISGGNFHGEPIGLAADYLKIALAEVGAISERRIYRLIDEHMNEGLPPMLIMKHENVGLQSGLMMLQYSAASLVLENQALASPASVLSLPTSAGQEDHNANATMAARFLSKVIENIYHILAIELLTSAQAIDLRIQDKPEIKLGMGTNVAFQWIRSTFPFREDDFPLSEDVMNMVELLKKQELINLVNLSLN
ncbi:MAG: histidine ammonia-lyase [Chloroflexi bacterium RBG_16_48_8]|nr:MAG: histidine ammonia-lyase [Chloroflexi bacterium RBG_16_48_8]